ncbi:MFS transporter [Frondihabitans sp. VKM Ac-2883]|uniref:MFS transporter n=1 Tax=Frondihabitans sp. VKM Ac-2883 TaxID=2783823 RepID=UPI00188C1C96|nr:MFS transporter [Frondihabitans sp. VKM Ac-2883]MBF4577882.1 MFS transporter [Frondihabitans sp. VKM Ac-2883]
MSATSAIRTGPPTRNLIDRMGLPRPLVWGFVGLLLFMIGDGVESGYIAPYLAGNGAGNETNAAVIISVYGLVVTIGSWLSGAFSDVWGPRRVMIIGAVTWGVMEVLFLAVAIPSHNFVLILVIYGIRGIGYPFFAYGFLVWILAGSPANRLGSAVGWFYFAFTGGLPTLGSLLASGTQPIIGEYLTLWISLILVALGAVVTLVGIRKARGGQRLAAPSVTTGRSMINSIAIAFTSPRVGIGCLIRIVNTAPQFGLFVFFPTVFATDLHFGTAGWLRLVFVLGAANIFANLFFGVLSDKLGWHRTLRWAGCIGSAVSVLCFYFLPQVVGDRYWVSVLCAAFFGVTLAGFTPISVLMSLMAPGQKGNSIAVLNLGAGAATFVGPLVVAIFLAPLGAAGVTIIFAAMYVAAGIAVRWLRVPEESAKVVAEGLSLQDLADNPDLVTGNRTTATPEQLK